uniref:Uncharacterized protein n=1 Tax=Chromera velia CCMP2878 TaxID=1169474 RepID=A0A0G4I4T9_9ALVE|eukprot:Cvel_35853.t1-p1 / transcript=Cvel_35853.t1 / gene=Cvel_35853 / organism=Chromera_velia_CCMP2878 / gene_product=hypothetical protein / transcript_product=hypothetical protein / location=Cvel_scaffold6750:421-789(+) / protein_length=123 / sequence_SO=supercontig / SO=protein_coding / is_pseudo=false
MERYEPAVSWKKKQAHFSAEFSPSGCPFTWYDSELYFIPEDERAPFTPREIRKLAKKQSTVFRCYRMEMAPAPVSLQCGYVRQAEQKAPSLLSAFPAEHPINGEEYTDLRKAVGRSDLRPEMK